MNNLKYTLFLFLFSITISVSAQSSDFEEWLSIGVFLPTDDYDTRVTPDLLQKLETKVVGIISSNGISSKISAFRIQLDSLGDNKAEQLMEVMAKGVVCIPKFEIYDAREVDTGMKKLLVVDASLTLSIQYIYSDIIFSTFTMQLQGSGNDTLQALNATLRNLRHRDKRWQRYLSESRQEIIRYYDNICDKLMDQATQLNKLDEPFEALMLLWPIPKEVACHTQAEELTVEIYRNFIDQECRKDMQLARSLLASNDYVKGLQILGRINPNSQCAADADALIAQVALEFDDTEVSKLNAQIQLAREERMLEESRKDARREREMDTMIGERNRQQFNDVIVIKK